MRTKGLTEDLINKFSILYGSKSSYSGILQNHFFFTFYQLKSILNVFMALLKFIRGNIIVCNLIRQQFCTIFC